MSHERRKRFLNGLKKKRAGFLSEKEVQIIKTQIRRDSRVIDGLIRIIDLLVNKERCPSDSNLLLSLRKRLTIAIEENDTFRRVLWRHLKMVEASMGDAVPLDPISFLVEQIKARERCMRAQAVMK